VPNGGSSCRGLVRGLEYKPSASLIVSLTLRVNVLTYGTIRRSVEVSKGTFFEGVEGMGGASRNGSYALLLFCSASMTERALASESLRGLVAMVFDSWVAGVASASDLAGIGEDCGVKIPLLEGRIDFRSGRADWGGFLVLSS
jgi:hypothetical protein